MAISEDRVVTVCFQRSFTETVMNKKIDQHLYIQFSADKLYELM